MPTTNMQTLDASPPSSESLGLLRARLLCVVVEQNGHANNFRRTVTELTGAQDVDSILEREIAEVATGRADTAIAEARDALSKLDDGSYGVCEHCRGLIPFERLEAIPQTRFCVHCAAIA